MPQRGKAVLNLDRRVTEMVVRRTSSSTRERTSSVATVGTYESTYGRHRRQREGVSTGTPSCVSIKLGL
ncbi:hypothetical protein M080_6523, partial [Bacteroides fragilis str. 3397 T10]